MPSRTVFNYNQLLDTVPFNGAGDTGKVPAWNGSALVPTTVSGVGGPFAALAGADFTGPVTAPSFQGDLIGNGASVSGVNANQLQGRFPGFTDGDIPYVGAGGYLPTSVFPPLTISQPFAVANQAAMLALTAERGDVAIRADNGKSYILSTDNPGTLGDWLELTAPGSVTAWNGLTGNIVATTTNLPEGTNLYYTDARVKTVLSHINDLFLQSGVTGTGTSVDPIIGWQAYVNGSPPGTSWHMSDGIWDETAELNPAASGVKIYGAGSGVTIIRSHHSTALSAVVRFKAPGSADLFGVRLQGVTLDGNGLTPIGLFADNTLSSQFIDIEFKNCTTHCFQGTRGIRNTYQDWFAWNSRMTTHTPNGFWFGVAGATTGTDNATTTSFMSLYAAELTGVGLKMTDDCFNNVVTGAITGCGTNLDIGQKTDVSKTAAYNNVFHCDLEGAGASAVNVAGEGHQFVCCNMPGSNLTITGAGKHSFIRCYVANGAGSINVSGATGDSVFEDCYGITTSNWNSLVNGTHAVLKIAGTTYNARKGVTTETLDSTTGDAVVRSNSSTGHRFAHWVTNANGTYLIDTGIVVDFTDLAATAAAAAIKIAGLNVTFTNALVVPGITVYDTNVAIATIQANDGTGAVCELYSVGDTLGYVAARGHYVYISANGSFVYTTVQMELEYNIRVDTSRNVLIGGILTSPSLVVTGDITHGANKIDKVVTLTDGATTTFDLSLGDMGRWTIGGNRTFAVSNGHSGSFVVRITQDGTGTRIATWPASFKFSGGSTLSTAAGAVDLLAFVSLDDGTTYQATLTTGHA